MVQPWSSCHGGPATIRTVRLLAQSSRPRSDMRTHAPHCTLLQSGCATVGPRWGATGRSGPGPVPSLPPDRASHLCAVDGMGPEAPCPGRDPDTTRTRLRHDQDTDKTRPGHGHVLVRSSGQVRSRSSPAQATGRTVAWNLALFGHSGARMAPQRRRALPLRAHSRSRSQINL